MAQWMTRPRFAELCGLGNAAIGQACKPGGKLDQAVSEDGKQVDADHPDAIRYMARAQSRVRKPGRPRGTPNKRPGYQDDGTAQSMAGLGELTLDEIGRRIGSAGALETWLKPLKLKEEIREKRLKNLETEHSMIARDLVRVHVLGALEDASRRLLLDSSRTIARIVMAETKAGKSAEAIEKTVRDLMSKPLTKAKQQASRKLRGIEGET
jgi:hypothetical protein